MTFLARLCTYLERVAQAPEGVPILNIDAASHRRRLIELAEALLKGAESYQHQALRTLLRHERQFQAFVRLAARRILDTLAPDASPEELSESVHSVLSVLVKNENEPSSLTVREIGLLPIARWAWEHTQDDDALDGWHIVAHYAFETRLVKRQERQATLSRAGALLLELPGIEAVRWLLALESVQSLGSDDDWRVSPELADALLKSTSHHVWTHDEDPTPWPHSMASLRRLGALQLLKYYGSDLEHEYAWGYELSSQRARPLLEELAAGHSTPFSILARALLHDERDRAVARLSPEYARAAQEGAAATVTLQARMVVHEVRNALVPAQMALSSLLRGLGEVASTEHIARQAGRIEAGLGRALGFAGQMLRAANLGDEPHTAFDATSAVREATASMAGLLNGHLHCGEMSAERVVFGPRARFLLAVVNLLRNAAQAVLAGGRIEVSFGTEESRAVVYIDDNGPGVPPEHRRTVFEAGFALRTGGSGQGLALARQVIEAEMLGRLTCDVSPLGGARFAVDVPIYERRNA